MSTAHRIHAITCRDCLHTGELDFWSDDMNRWGVTWLGFANGAVKLMQPSTAKATCVNCGSADIEVDQNARPAVATFAQGSTG